MFSKVTTLLWQYECRYFQQKPVLRWLLEVQKSGDQSFPGQFFGLNMYICTTCKMVKPHICRFYHTTDIHNNRYIHVHHFLSCVYTNLNGFYNTYSSSMTCRQTVSTRVLFINDANKGNGT